MKKIFYIASLLLISATACNKALDVTPPNQISTDSYWKTSSDLNNYIVQFYGSFPRFGNAPGSLTGYMGFDGYTGSDMQIVGTPKPQLNGTRTQVNGSLGTTWDFTNIRSVNIFFENYSKVNEPWSNIGRYVGEAYFFRAWFYFNLVKQYGDVPWYSHSMQIDDPALYAPRTPRTQVVDSIMADLDSAIANLDLRKNVAGGSNRLSKEVALIFKSRVALFEGTWQKYHAADGFGTQGANPAKYLQLAVDAVKELMTPGKYAVGLAATYPSVFNSDDQSGNKEVLLWRKYDNTLSFAHNFQQYITSSTDEVSVTLQQVENYLKSDGTPYNFLDTATTVKGTAFLSKISKECDPRLKSIIWIPGQNMWTNTAGVGNFVKPALDKTGGDKNFTGFQLSKGANPVDPTAGGALGFGSSCKTGSVLFRYAEALLNLAEAQAELGQTVDYANTINLLRARAGMPAFEVHADANRAHYADFGYALPDELHEIRRERAVELACEGLRFDDWRRWAGGNLFKGKRPLGFPYLASEYAASLTIPTSNGFVDPFQNVLPSGYNFNEKRDYLDCVPVNEITLNPKLTKNPGW